MKHVLATLLGSLFLFTTPVPAMAADQKPLPWLGMAVRSFRDPSGQRFLHVDHTAPGGPAERAGIRPGDIIVRMGGATLQIGDDLDFLMFLTQHKPGERLPMRIARYGRTIELVVTFASMPEALRPAWNHTLEVARRNRLAADQAKIH